MNLKLKDKIVLITGGTGSLGNSLVENLLDEDVKKIIIYSRNEFNQVKMERKYPRKKFKIRYHLGDIRDKDNLYRSFDNIDIVINCAAIKHIDKAQYCPFEAVKTNTIGVQNIIDAAINRNVEKVISISTDKAVNPTSLYGASKLCADYLLIAANNYSPNKTKFSVIRFGNFWNSSGSIIEYLFKQSSNKNCVIPLTDPRMTRFFLTLNEASNFIIEALEIMNGFEIFTPKIKARKIVDVMNDICDNPVFKNIGIRPGEKLHEELIVSEHFRQTYEDDKWFITYPIGYEGKTIGKKILEEGFEYNSKIALEK